MPTSVIETKISTFLAKYDAPIAAELRAARTRLRAHFTTGYELVFDNYNALVFGISTSERQSDAFISVAGYPRWVTLFFLHGTSLTDPEGLLVGQGKQVRSIRLTSALDIDTPAIRALIEQASEPRLALLLAAPALTTIVKTEAMNARARRPAAAKRLPAC